MKNEGVGAFHWQRGYGAFSVSPTDLSKLLGYIDQQEEHHQKLTFQQECRKFLNKYQIDYDENYVWD
ncbi:transposase [Rubritalea profundi]|uniref:transposase n=1 Tax=Rubritalea profundi TaxID=1658618 RepID=UPI001F0C21EF|nr:transposase [Rubritalea profundi]